jgi:hypothetical protein
MMKRECRSPKDNNERLQTAEPLSFEFPSSFVIPHSSFRSVTMNDELESKMNEAIKNQKNLGEMTDADAVGTVGAGHGVIRGSEQPP